MAMFSSSFQPQNQLLIWLLLPPEADPHQNCCNWQAASQTSIRHSIFRKARTKTRIKGMQTHIGTQCENLETELCEDAT